MKENVTQTMGRVETSFNNAYKKNQAFQKQLDENAASTKKFGHSIDELGLKLDNLTKKRNVSIDFKDISKLNREINDVEKQLNKMRGLGSTPGRFSMANLKEGASQIPGMGGAMALGANPYVMGAMAIGAIGKTAYEFGKVTLGFDQQFAKINATAQLKKPELAALRKEVMELGRASSTDIHQVPEAYDKILSATNDVRLSTDILKQSLKGAQAGFTDVNLVAGTTTGILNAIGSDKHTSAEVMDVLFASKRLGVGEFSDFSNYLPAPISQGNALGYDYKETAAAFSYFTTRGNKADFAQTILTNLYSSLGRESVNKDLKKYGINLYNSEGKRNNLLSVVQELEAKMAGKTDLQRTRMMNDIFEDQQARAAVNELLADTKKLGSIMRETANSSGELKKALDATENGMNDLQKLANNWEAFKDNLGQAVAPTLNSIFQTINEEFEAFFSHRDRTALANDPTKRDEYRKLVEKDYMEGIRRKDMTGVDGQYNGRTASLELFYKNSLGWDEQKIKSQEALLKYQALQKTNDSPVGKPAMDKKADSQAKATEDETNSMLNKTMDSISGGGSVKNFTVNIGKFQDKTEIHSANLTEGLDEVEKKQFDMFMRIIQGVELTAGAN
ncbi:MAG: phage tail tape measure protein [Bacteroidetes bacterium]|nr:phage tail tape measure protein [Bacteroidota bacterium]